MVEFPQVRTRKWKLVDFEPDKLKRALKRETTLNDENIEFICNRVYSFIISHDLKVLSEPLIRVLENYQLANNGFEKERLQNGFIGISQYKFKDKMFSMDKETFKDYLYEKLTRMSREVDNLIEMLEGLSDE